jgi:hypothetical protein
MWRRVFLRQLDEKLISTRSTVILNPDCSLVEPNNSNIFEGRHGFKKTARAVF